MLRALQMMRVADIYRRYRQAADAYAAAAAAAIDAAAATSLR